MDFNYSGYFRIEIEFLEKGQNNGITTFFCKNVNDLIEYATAYNGYLPLSSETWRSSQISSFISPLRGAKIDNLDKLHIFQNIKAYKPTVLPTYTEFNRLCIPFVLHIYQPGMHGQYDIHNQLENLNSLPKPHVLDGRLYGLAREYISRTFLLCDLFINDKSYDRFYNNFLTRVIYHTRTGVKVFPMQEEHVFQPFITLEEAARYKNIKKFPLKFKFLDILKQFIEDY